MSNPSSVNPFLKHTGAIVQVIICCLNRDLEQKRLARIWAVSLKCQLTKNKEGKH